LVSVNNPDAWSITLDPFANNNYTIRMVNIKRRPSRKVALLEQACKIIVQEGIQALTIDAVAKASAVTKGGVQYHFRSKDILLEDLMEWIFSQFTSEVETLAANQTGPHAWLKAYVRCLTRKPDAGDRVVSAILADFEPDDPRAGIYRRHIKSWRSAALQDGFPKAQAVIIQLAAESLWMERLYGNMHLKECKLVGDQLQKLIRLQPAKSKKPKDRRSHRDA
jgi:AcrR family transcriptional regulator